MPEEQMNQAPGTQAPAVWEISGRNTVVELAPQAAERLLAEALSGLGLLSRGRGVEVGGLLLGWVVNQGERWRVRVEEVRVMPCEHAQGPAFVLSEPELAQLRRAAATWARRPGRRRYLVGYWRSHTRGQVALRPSDLATLQELQVLGCELALLVEPHGAGPAEAALFLPEGHTFPPSDPAAMREIRLPRRTQGRRERAPGTAAAAEAVPPAPPTGSLAAGELPGTDVETSFRFSMFEPGNQAAPKPGGRRLWWLALLLLIGVAGAGAWAYKSGLLRLPEGHDPADPYALGLKVARQGENLHLSWDGRCPAIARAQQAILVIADGDRLRVLELDKAQLVGGTIVYRPIQDRVSFRMEVRWPNGSLSEAVGWPESSH
ncbi:MAG: hypothetical protein ACP5U2_07840 [Bryobacteraceae bacterium]